MLLLTVRCFYLGFFCLFVCFLKNRKLWPSMQVARNFPSENRVQSTDNKHSISQLEKRTCTSLFCSRRKSKDKKLAASQNRGHSTEHKQVSLASRLRATACTEFTSLWLYCPPSCYLHLDALCCGSQNRKKPQNKNTHTPSFKMRINLATRSANSKLPV